MNLSSIVMNKVLEAYKDGVPNTVLKVLINVNMFD